MDDLATKFNSKVFEYPRGDLGWLRFRLEGVLTNDLERLKNGDGVTVAVALVDALGRPHEGTLREPWERS